METMILKNRITHKYVGDYSYLDEWKEIGTATILMSADVPDETDCDGGMEHFRYVKVELDGKATDDEIADAIYSSFAFGGCACSHDCCGCRSGSVTQAEKCDRFNFGHKDAEYQIWMVMISSHCNY